MKRPLPPGCPRPAPGRPTVSGPGAWLGAALLLPLLSSGCGLGTLVLGGAAAGGGGGGGGGGPNVPAGLSSFQVTSRQVSPAQLGFLLSDALSANVEIEFRQRYEDASSFEVELPLTGLAQNPVQLQAAPGGQAYQLSWNFSGEPWADPSGALVPEILVWARVAGSLEEPVLGLNAVLVGMGNDAPAVLTLSVPTSGSGVIGVPFSIADSSSDPLDVRIEFDRIGDDPDQGFQPATPQFQSATPPLTFQGLASSPTGLNYGFAWNSALDLAQDQGPVRLRATAFDGVVDSAPLLSAVFQVDNNTAPLATVDGGAFLSSPDRRRGLALPFRVIDAESDPVRAFVQWRTPAGVFPQLPATLSELLAALEQPGQQAALQLATPYPKSASGPLEVLAADSLRLVEIAERAPWALAEGLVGRELELIDPSRNPAPLAAGWANNSLSGPVAALPDPDPRFALVLDQGPPGWRLSRLLLADGTRTTLASATGNPNAATLLPDGSAVLIASDLAGEWRIDRYRLNTQALEPVYQRASDLPLGAVRGLCATGPSRWVLTVANSLIEGVELPAAPAVPVRAARLINGLQEPTGVAADPLRPGYVLLAESQWSAPGGPATGRLLWVDTRRRSTQPLFARSAALPNAPLTFPRAVALDLDGRHAFVIAGGPSPSDPPALYEVALGALGQSLGVALGEYAGSVGGIATGLDGRVLVAWTSAQDLAAAGGVRARSTVLAFDAASSIAELADPVSTRPGDLWRVTLADWPRVLATPEGQGGTFLWDSRDVPAGQGALLRVVPYDQDRGLAAQSSAPKTPLGAFEVTPQGIPAAGAPSGQQARGLDLGDLDGDGDLDLIGVFPGSTTPLASFRQSAPGVFVAAETFATSADDPVGVSLGDLNRDGTLDAVVANAGSDDLSLWLQSAPGVLTGQAPIRLGGPVETPGLFAVELADLDRDGDLDLLAAGASSTRPYLNLGSGVFTASTALAGGPAPARAADVTNDGLLDALLGNSSASSALRRQAQSAPGVFAAAPGLLTQVLAPLARQMLPVDLDGDGRLEIYAADGQTRLLGFQQDVFGGLDAEGGVDLEFPSASGGFLAGDLTSGDLDRDGTADLVLVARGARRAGLYLSAGQPVDPASAPAVPLTPLVVGPGGAFTSTTNESSAVGLADLDGDGALELITGAGGGLDRYAPVLAGRFGTAISYSALFSGSPPRTQSAFDLDADGDLDLLLSNASGAPRLLLQSAPTLFEPRTLANAGVNAAQVACGDFDGDGRADLVCAGGASLAIYHQAADGSFPGSGLETLTDPRFDFAADTGHRLLAVDWDRDGDLDLLGVSKARRSLLLIPQTPAGLDPTQLIEIQFPSGSSPRQTVALDLDGDGLLDLAVADVEAGLVRIVPGAPGGGFDLGSQSALPAPSATLLEVADLDGDGRVDLLTNGPTAAALGLLRQLPGGGFSAVESLALPAGAPGSAVRSLALVDLDLDGRLDIAAKLDGALARLLQVSAGRFVATGDLLGTGAGSSGASSEGLLGRDLDGDGDPDLFGPGLGGERLSAFYASH